MDTSNIKLYISPTFGEPTPALKRARKAVMDATYTLDQARHALTHAEKRHAANERTLRDVDAWLASFEAREGARHALGHATANLRARMAELGRLQASVPRRRETVSRLPYVTGTTPRLGERSKCIAVNRCVVE